MQNFISTIRDGSLPEIAVIPVFTLTSRSVPDIQKFLEFTDPDASVGIHQSPLTQCQDICPYYSLT